MRNLIASLFLFASLSSFAQVSPITSGSILAYDVFGAKQGFLQTEVTFQPNREQRVLKLDIESNGNRNYVLLNNRPFAIYDKSFTRISNRGVAVSAGDYFLFLPKDQKIEVGTKWEFSRSGYGDACANWNATHRSTTQKGPETTISIDGKDTSVKTLLIEQSGVVSRSNGCAPLQIEALILFSPELNEVVMHQSIDTTEDKKLQGGYKWILKSITTTAGQATK